MRTPPEHLEAPHMLEELEDVGWERERERYLDYLACWLLLEAVRFNLGKTSRVLDDDLLQDSPATVSHHEIGFPISSSHRWWGLSRGYSGDYSGIGRMSESLVSQEGKAVRETASRLHHSFSCSLWPLSRVAKLAYEQLFFSCQPQDDLVASTLQQSGPNTAETAATVIVETGAHSSRPCTEGYPHTLVAGLTTEPAYMEAETCSDTKEAIEPLRRPNTVCLPWGAATETRQAILFVALYCQMDELLHFHDLSIAAGTVASLEVF